MVEVAVNLPYGVKKLLVLREYDKVHQHLVEVEEWRQVEVSPGSKKLVVYLKLDYEIYDQPGTGMFSQ